MIVVINHSNLRKENLKWKIQREIAHKKVEWRSILWSRILNNIKEMVTLGQDSVQLSLRICSFMKETCIMLSIIITWCLFHVDLGRLGAKLCTFWPQHGSLHALSEYYGHSSWMMSPLPHNAQCPSSSLEEKVASPLFWYGQVKEWRVWGKRMTLSEDGEEVVWP